jgi:hypothetical protein
MKKYAHYNYEHYNCAHFVATWYAEKLGIEMPVTNQFELSFVRWMRNHFIRIDTPVENCLVYMKSHGTSHVGVFSDYGVFHNLKCGNAKGAVVHWDLGVVKRNYEKVSYWLWSQ